ncbi:MAG: hypothetical protein RBU30_13885 [Polyangia bacterium]|jgi:hypothetical protein|nr:hypothetical protein [Polyangia bacterium]
MIKRLDLTCLGTLAPLLLACAIASACDETIPGGEVEPYEPPGFALQDLNPDSASYLQTLSPETARGGVLLLYFASYT